MIINGCSASIQVDLKGHNPFFFKRDLRVIFSSFQDNHRVRIVRTRTDSLQFFGSNYSGSKMMGSFLTRGLVMIFGYAYPAYECYKTVEMNKPEIEQLRFWCQYWILVAMLTVFERVGDTFVSWVPMYSEAKLAFYIYLWYPKTKGTVYVYDSFFRPYLAKHEMEIDRNLMELRTRAGDMAIMYWQKTASYGQTRFFEILQYFASQSTTRPRPAQQPQPQPAGAHQAPPSVPTHQPAVTPQQEQPLQPPSRTSSSASTQQQPKQPPSRTSSSASTQQQPKQPPTRTASTGSTKRELEQAQDAGPSVVPPAPTVALAVKTAVAQSKENEAETMQIDPVANATEGNESPSPQETVIEEAIRVTRGRLRKSRAAVTR